MVSLPPVNTMLQGDSLAVLCMLPDEYVQCIVTSPPYLWQRDYDVLGQIGLEETPEQYVAKMVEVFREARRVLRRDGVLWLNLGDTRANDKKWGGSTGGKHVKALHGQNATRRRRSTGLPEKNLLGMPWRVAFALQADGWILRQECIWEKSNVTPESIEDRPTTSHEHIFLLTKSPRYFYDAESAKEPTTGNTHSRGNGTHPKSAAPGSGIKANVSWELATRDIVEMRNKRSVMSVATQGYEGAHYATFPQKLIEPLILAGSSPWACEHCRAPWKRVFVPTGHSNKREAAHVPGNSLTKTDSTGWAPVKMATAKWQPTCRCSNNTGSGKCIVLDCFMGAGTTALVALEQGRDYLGIELSEAYIAQAYKRIAVYQPRLWNGSEAAS